MLNNLKAELVRKGYRTPSDAIAGILGCTQKTARNKLQGKSPFTILEAEKIKEKIFLSDNFTVEYLFFTNEKGAKNEKI